MLGGIFSNLFSDFNRALCELILKALIRRRLFCGAFDQSLSIPRKKEVRLILVDFDGKSLLNVVCLASAGHYMGNTEDPDQAATLRAVGSTRFCLYAKISHCVRIYMHQTALSDDFFFAEGEGRK